MPTINTESIEGFAEMTAEQKVEALLKMEIPEKVDLSGYIQKSQFDKVSSELADAKKTIKSKMTEDEAAKAQADAERKDLQEKYDALLKKSTVAEHTARYIAMGYEEKLARDTAEALYDGDMDKVFENQKKANEALEKNLRASLVRQDPKPDGAGGGKDDEESESVKLARKLGKQRAEAEKASSDALKYYL